MGKFSACVYLFLLLGVIQASQAAATDHYFVGAAGANCVDACATRGMNCNAAINTDNSSTFFQRIGVRCSSFNDSLWISSAQPSVDSVTGVCSGFVDVPSAVACQGREDGIRRICHCEMPRTDQSVLGTAWSQGMATPHERSVFFHALGPNQFGHMNHFWLTPSNPTLVVRYYVDGEENASISFHPSLACGVGFDDQQAPWGTKWFGKGAKTGGWFWNFLVPFTRSIRVTVQTGTPTGLYIILRGVTTGPTFLIGSVEIPSTARLQQFRTDVVLPPLAFVDFATIPAGKQGYIFQHTLAVSAPNPNFLEGCYHFYSPANTSWPGILLSSGTEDYFDSAYYFNAGEFHLPVSGFTHVNYTMPNYSNVSASAYRFHEQDPLLFKNGARLQWRNGDMQDRSGVKCLIEQNGHTVGHPGQAHVRAYVWVYTW